MKKDLFPFSGSDDARESFMEIERLASINELIAGIIHELNDPLSAILGFSEILQSLDIDPEIKRYTGNIYVAALRSAKIVESLLTFMKKKETESAAININNVIKQAATLFEYQMRTRNISLTMLLSPDIPWIKGDAYKLQQVFFNLLMNALQALESWSGEKKVTLSSEFTGDSVRVVFSDSGPGIPIGNADKIFTPFFSTKPKGTGLGLNIVYGIIEEHGGNVSVTSGENGCSFVLNLPPAECSPIRPRYNRLNTAKSHKRILLVDDDELVLNAMSRVMETIGCNVIFVTNAVEALAELQRGDFDIIFVDYSLPDMDGIDLIEKASAFVDIKKFIIITGDITFNAEAAKQKYNIPILWKPIGLKEFKEVIFSHV